MLGLLAAIFACRKVAAQDADPTVDATTPAEESQAVEGQEQIDPLTERQADLESLSGRLTALQEELQEAVLEPDVRSGVEGVLAGAEELLGRATESLKSAAPRTPLPTDSELQSSIDALDELDPPAAFETTVEDLDRKKEELEAELEALRRQQQELDEAELRRTTLDGELNTLSEELETLQEFDPGDDDDFSSRGPKHGK